MLNELKSLTTGAELPTDDIDVAKKVLADLMKQMKERHIVFDISDLPLNTAAEVNIARIRLEELLAQTDEINYATERLIILPITLEQFRDFFVNLFETNQAKPEKLVELINSCVDKRDEMEAPEWKSYIESSVQRLGAYVQSLTPYLKNKDSY